MTLHLNFMSVYRKRKKITQWELSNILKVDQVRISSWETGKAMPTLTLRQKIAGVLGIGIDSIWPNDKE